jgi:uncharacterized protein YndB with AHSA1/START domain
VNIDQTAPMSAREQILIAAPLEKVWSVLTEIEQSARGAVALLAFVG